MNRHIDNAKLAIVINPLATPFKTSIELIVLPIIGIMKTTSAMYSNGIWTVPNNGKARFESYAPSSKIGAAQNARATGLNHPPIVFLSSISPTIKAKNVVKSKASISEIGKNIYKMINDDSIPTIIDNPPGLATIVFSFLFASTTVMLRFSKTRITKGVNPYTERNAMVIAIIAGIISCSNYLTFST